MTRPLILATELGKKYRIGLRKKKPDTILASILNMIKAPLSNLARIRNLSKLNHEEESIFWALKDVSFEVCEGDVLGVIGHNGAGKSTLLKILSQITEPSEGEVILNGRVSSLLEVGTGFHPELTGRENVFMNGTILGMTRGEITSKFDEIVDFSGVSKYIDTPVKFYSSGMKVRLGFAVAAHLDPEILIIDEVLAVGDAEFQKKCLGKMESVAENGRTVIFVSHNMNAVSRLCSKGIVLKGGQLSYSGNIEEAISHYEGITAVQNTASHYVSEEATGDIQLKSARVVFSGNEEAVRPVRITEPFAIHFNLVLSKEVSRLHMAVHIKNNFGEVVFFSDLRDDKSARKPSKIGSYTCEINVPSPLLKPGQYSISIGAVNLETEQSFQYKDILSFQIVDYENARPDRPGYIFMPLKWNFK